MIAPDPRIAVVIATQNRADSLRRTLARLIDLPEQPRVVVVDNGSSDGTVEMVRSLRPEIGLIPLGENRGAAARNLGVERVETPYVAFADDDSWWSPGSLSLAADLLDMRERLALVAARILVGEDERLDPTCAEMARSPLSTAPGSVGPAVLGFLACGAVVRRSAYLEAGGFSPRFGVGGEEQLLALDLAAGGWELSYVAAVVAHHHPSPSRDPARRRRTQARNSFWCLWLRRPAGSALRRTAHLLVEGARDDAVRVGFLTALASLRSVLRDRSPITPELERAVILLDRWTAEQGASRR